MKLKALAIALTIIATPAFAQQPPSAEMTIEQVMQINAGLSQLNCVQRVIKDGAKETLVCDPYKWGIGASWLIASNLRRTQEIASQYTKLRNQALANLARKPDGDATNEAAAKFAVDDRGYLDVKVSIVLDHFKRSDLEPMNLPPSVITLLLPIIE